uniref:Uncharacterized protein n=1 Tax=Acrobeloides nanus TaxID=290746 RepID=A0A914CBJ9_9BILA
MLLIFLSALTIATTLGIGYECPEVSKFPNIIVNEFTDNDIIIEDEKVYLREGHQVKLLKITDDKIKIDKTIHKKKLRSAIHDTCPNIIPKIFCINNLCSSINIGFDEEICIFTANLQGCPLLFETHKERCSMNATSLFNHTLKKLLPLKSPPDEVMKIKDDYSEFVDIQYIDYDTIAILSLFPRVGAYVVSLYSIKEISRRLDDENSIKMVLNHSNLSKQQWSPYRKGDKIGSNVLLLHPFSPNFDRAMLNFKINKNEGIVAYRAFEFQNFANTTFQIHIFATNQGKIIKGIVKDNVGNHFNLWCKIPGKIKQIKIYLNKWILVLTNTMLLMLPIEQCGSYDYTNCIKRNDPYCAIQEDKQNPCVSTLGVSPEKLNSLRQGTQNDHANQIWKSQEVLSNCKF